MVQYYTRRRTGSEWEFKGPFNSYDAAMDDHTKACWHLPSSEWPRMQTLFDMSAIADEQQMRELLHHDPVLHAVFEIGRRIGQRDLKDARLSTCGASLDSSASRSPKGISNVHND